MKKGDKKKQKKVQKRQVQKKQSLARLLWQDIQGPLYHVRHARDYPIQDCYVHEGWEESGLAVVVVIRRQPNGHIVFGNYLVDYYCLGLKNTFCNADIPPHRFQREFMPKLFRVGRPLKISAALAHEIVYGGIEYAARFGFRPQRDFKDSQYVLDPPETHPRTGTVEFGYEGKPFFISGPYDNVDAIIRQLRRTAGEGNFEYMMQIGGPPPDEWTEDEGEEDDWEEDDAEEEA